MNNRLNTSTKVMAITVVSLIVGAYFLLNKTPNEENAEQASLSSVETENNKAVSVSRIKDEPLTNLEKETEKSTPSPLLSIKEKKSNGQHTKQANDQLDNNTVLESTPDELINEQELPEYEPLSIGEFIPATTLDMIAAEEEYESDQKKYTALTEVEIQAEFESFNNEVNALSIGKEIGKFIPVDGVPNNEPSKLIEIGEFIPVDPELL